MEVHHRNLRLGIAIGTTLLLFLASALSVALQTQRATQTTVSSNQNSGNANVGEDYGRRKVPISAKATTTKKPPAATTQTEPKPTTDTNDSGGQRSGTGTTPPQKPPTRTPPAQGPQFEGPKLVADKSVVLLGELVTFKLDQLSDYVRTHYSFVIDYGDGSPTETLDPKQQGLSHRFRSLQIFQVSAKAIPAHSDVPPDEKGIEPIPITVEHVGLSVDKNEVEVGVVVKLTAESVSNDSNVQYRFVFDDGNQTEWQGSKVATYQYSAVRKYKPHVEVGFAERGGIVSVDKSDSQITVTKPPPGALVFHVPPQVNANQQVTLSAEFPANGRHIQYRFVFDDGTQPVWQDDATATHTYGEGRTYHPYVEVGFLPDQTASAPSTPSAPVTIATSPSQPLVVVPVATQAVSPTAPANNPGPGTDWRDYLVPILIALVVLLVLVIFTAGGIGAYKAVKWAFAPRPTFVPYIDPGRAELAQGSAMPLINFELHLDPNAGNGFYEIIKSGPTLIGAERSHP